MSKLVTEHCVACRGDVPRIEGGEQRTLLDELNQDWQVRDGRLRRRFAFPDFVGAFSFATAIALLAEAERHHPELTVGWGHLDVELVTHAVAALTRNDFILAARIDATSGDTPS